MNKSAPTTIFFSCKSAMWCVMYIYQWELIIKYLDL